MRGAANITEHAWTYGVRYIANQIDRATWRHTLTHRLSSDLTLGLEYNPLVGEVGLRGNWRALAETVHLPSLTFGTSSDRIGTPDGQAYFVTMQKDLTAALGVPIAPYVSLFWSEFDQEFLVPFGASVALHPRWIVQPISDGRSFHFLVTHIAGRYSITGMLVHGRDPGLAVNFGL